MFRIVWLMLIACFAYVNDAEGREWSCQDVPERPVRPQSFKSAALIEFKGEINTALKRYFDNRFERARREGVDLLIVEIDSPGGLKFESLEMAAMLAKCDWAYTIALIPREAQSGGALVALGCDEIMIAPDAKFGNIGEIGFDPEVMAFRLIRPKIESTLSHDARQLARAKGRPEDLVEAFVDKDILIYFKTNRDGTIEFRQSRVDSHDKPDAPWELIPESRAERFLVLNGIRAKELTLAQHLTADRTELAQELGIEKTAIRTYQYSTNDSIVHWLNNPLITGVIIAIGLIALYVELSTPGLGAGGLMAGLCMLLFFWSRYLGGTAGWLEVILFATGLIFLLMEIFVIPGFGIAGFTGVLLLFTSVILAGQHFTIPSTTEEWNQSINSVLVLLGSVACFMVSAVFISRHFGSIPLFRQLVLEPPPLTEPTSGKDAQGKPLPTVHPHVSVGDWGKAESLLRPAGRARFAGRSFDVISDGQFIEPGSQVKVIRIAGNVITVTNVEDV